MVVKPATRSVLPGIQAWSGAEVAAVVTLHINGLGIAASGALIVGNGQGDSGMTVR